MQLTETRTISASRRSSMHPIETIVEKVNEEEFEASRDQNKIDEEFEVDESDGDLV